MKERLNNLLLRWVRFSPSKESKVTIEEHHTKPRDIETYSIPRGPGYSVRDVFESGSRKLLRTEVAWPKSHLGLVSDEDTPSFAEGACVIIGWGANKLAIADQDGKSDYLIKRYKHHIYEGVGASDRAQLAANQIKDIYMTLRAVCGDYILPTKVICAPYSPSHPERMGVYEIQKRALLTSAHRLDAEESGKRVKEAGDVRSKWSYLIEHNLKVKGIKPLNGIVDFHPIYWDWVTMHLVAFDVIDGVDLSKSDTRKY